MQTRRECENGGNEDERDHDMCDRRCSDVGRVLAAGSVLYLLQRKKEKTKK